MAEDSGVPAVSVVPAVSATPAVSVVMATYNRCDVLAHAIESVRGQTVRDWELLVVGDACTDATGEVVASFNDERIRFVNRRVNHGEQSAPNNDGVAMARGELIAFLNHDDLWYPDHLEVGLAALERANADLVYALRATVRPDRSVDVQGAGAIRNGLLVHALPASSWIFRRGLAERVGPWRSAFELRLVPSQDWLIRALNAGARVACTEALTLVMVPSGSRKDSYLFTDPADLRAALALLTERGRDELLRRPPPPPRRPGAIGAVRRALRWRLEALLLLCRYHPHAVNTILLRDPRPGRYMRRLRATRGLSPFPHRAHHG